MKESENKVCNCLRNSEQLIQDKIKSRANNKNGYEIIDSEWEHKSIYPEERLYANYIIEYTFKNKQGITTKPKKEKIPIFFTYCPFCGIKINEK